MVVDMIDEQRVSDLFHALADPTRRDIIKRSMRGDHSVSALARHYPMSFAAVQKHVAVLDRAGLVTKHHEGRERHVQTDIETVRLATRLLQEIEEVWRSRIDRIGDLLVEEAEGDHP